MLKSDAQAAFDIAALASDARAKVGDRDLAPCIMADGIISTPVEGRGSYQISRRATLVMRADACGPVEPGVRVTLETGGQSYSMRVASDEESILSGGGALVQFTLTDS